jgi:uncharacterized PurR-regulated membrane protein YhhQ (DUF165 family)
MELLSRSLVSPNSSSTVISSCFDSYLFEFQAHRNELALTAHGLRGMVFVYIYKVTLFNLQTSLRLIYKYLINHFRWHVWCRSRTLETGLKWMTGILSSVAIMLFICSIFLACYLRRVALHPETRITFRKSEAG